MCYCYCVINVVKACRTAYILALFIALHVRMSSRYEKPMWVVSGPNEFVLTPQTIHGCFAVYEHAKYPGCLIGKVAKYMSLYFLRGLISASNFYTNIHTRFGKFDKFLPMYD